MQILITGITGFMGAALAPRLQAEGHALRGLSRRHPDELKPGSLPGGAELAVADAVSGEGLTEALTDIEVAYYLIHSMEEEPASGGSPLGAEPSGLSFLEREQQAARNFAAAAVAAGVRRVIFLGGFAPTAVPASPHLASRLRVEETLLAEFPDTVALRASIVIGERSRSFRLLVRLVERLPLLPMLAWHRYRTAPVDQRDVIECLALAATATDLPRRSLDVAGPDVVSYGELLAAIKDELMLPRPTLNLDMLSATPLVSRLAAIVAGEQHALVGPLMDGLQSDLLPREPEACAVLHQSPHPLHAAIAHALQAWESHEPLGAR
jgi:uncharacterized protein YbjT (DUF2867 family)